MGPGLPHPNLLHTKLPTHKRIVYRLAEGEIEENFSSFVSPGISVKLGDVQTLISGKQ